MYKIAILFFIVQFCWSQEDSVETSAAFQQKMNAEFADSLSSPLSKEDLANFKALDFFPIDEKFIVKAKFVLSRNQRAFKMKTSTERTPMYIKYGELHFTIEGKALQLSVYKNIELGLKPGFKDYLFLPFTDVTSGNETYGAGRYIDLKVPEGDTIIIDFNKAYNPYCAYDYKYSCPKVPSENDLEIAIRAGVKNFHE